jgi:hypothetical protein
VSSLRRVVLALAPLLLAALAHADPDPRLKARLDPETAAAVGQIVTQAQANGLPIEPLIDKALEGSSKKAPGPRIVAAVRQYAQALAAAREALGHDSRESEIVVGAGALLAGVPADSLAGLRAALPGRSLVVPLVVMADLLARRVPAGTASNAILAASRAGVRDADLLMLRARVEEDIRAGTAPGTATMMRGRALLEPGGGLIAPQPRPHPSSP